MVDAAAQVFNAKVKAFRAALRGIRDEKFFLYRLAMIYAYPPWLSAEPGFDFSDGEFGLTSSLLLMVFLRLGDVHGRKGKAFSEL